MAHPQHNFTSNFNGSEGNNAELTLNINGVEKKYTPAGNDQTYNVPGVARIDISLDGADLVQAIQTALDGAAQPVLVEMSIYDEEYVYQYIGEIDGQWYFGTCTTTKIVTITVAKEDGAVNGEQIPVANGVVIVESDGLNVYSRLRTAIALGQLPVLSYAGANPVYAQYEKTADNGDLIFVGALASASDTYVQYNIYTVASNNTVTVTTRAASAGGGGTPDDENGFFNSSLYQTPGDGITESLTLNDFRIKQGTSIHGSNIEFVVTHTEGGIDFGEVWLNPGTYILDIRYTLQWVGNPRGTFAPLVCNVGGQPFDFSFEQENTLITSQIRVVTARQKVSIAFPFDADTLQMGIWVETLSIAQLASNTHPAVVHDTTLAGSGTAGSPLGVTTDAFGKIKDIPTSISQFRNGDVIPVDGPNGPAKMPKADLLTETAQNALAGNVAPVFDPATDYYADNVVIYRGVQYRFLVDHPAGVWTGLDVWDFCDKKSVVPKQRFATSDGTYKFTQKDFDQQTNRLLTPTKYPVFGGKGDVITITPSTGLKVTVLTMTMGTPPVYYPAKVVTSGNTDSYTFGTDTYYSLMVQKTDESSILLSDFGNTSIEITQKLASDIFAQNINNFSDAVKTDDSVTGAKIPATISDRYTATPINRKFSLLDLAARDGDIVFNYRDMAQVGPDVVRLAFIDVYKGDHIVFDGSSNNSLAIAYKVVGSTWTPMSGSGFTDYKASFDYEVLEDFTCAVDMKISGQPYAYTDYAYGSLRVSRAMSVRVLNKMKQDISNASGFAVPYPYAKVKDGKLVACDPIVQTSRADYLAVDMGGKVSYIGCKWYWPTAHGTRGVVCIASMPDTWSKKISGTNGITGKALHITCTRTNLRVDFLGADWGAPYYTNLINQALNLSSDPTVEHALSVTISDESVTVVVDGSTYTGTNSSDKSMDDVVGKYAFVEHYNASANEEDMPEYTAFHVGSANGRMYDNFARENGLCTMSPQGYPYINVGTATASFPVW